MIAEAAGLKKSRRQTISRTALTGFVAKAAMVLPTLVIAKLAIPELGPERFGVFMTILSLLAVAGMADMGVGSSLVTAVSRAYGEKDLSRIRILQINGFVAVCLAASLMLVLGFIASFASIGAAAFPHSSTVIKLEATRGIAAFLAVFAISLPFTLVGKVQLGLQRGDISNYWQIAAALINFCAAAVATSLGLGIVWMIVGVMSGTLMCGMANTVTHYYFHKQIRPTYADLNITEIMSLLRESGLYLALQAVFVLAYALDTLMVSRLLGAEQASVYALAERIFSVIAVAVAVFTAPLWAAYGEALGASDRHWARKTLYVSTLRIALMALVLALVILLLLGPSVSLLSSNTLQVPLGLAIGMAIWRVVEAVGGSLSVYVLAHRSVKFVLLAGLATALIAGLAKVFSISLFGMQAVPVSMSIVYILFCVVPTIWFVRKLAGFGA